MLLAQTVGLPEIILVVLYLTIIGYLGWLGWRHTKTAADYMIAGRQVHPFVMALSYGATFISTSAIVGFGGVAGMFGMSLLWLTFFNIFVGIFIAFVFLAGPTRRMGHQLDAHTFPELLGRRYNSRFMQVFAGLIIFLFIPLYAAAVLIGGCAFIASQFAVPYNVALLVFSVIIAAYVIMGGLKGVMYTDALQGSIMFIGMLILLIATYVKVGGVVEGHQQLVELGKQPNIFGGIGFKGWAEMPAFGWSAEETKYQLWWIVVSTITLGVGIGVLAQPQLSVRFMTVRSRKQLNRATLVGGLFILVMTGVAFTVGSLSNVYFMNEEVVEGTLTSVSGFGDSPAEWEWVIAKEQRNLNLKPDGTKINPAIGTNEKSVPAALLHIDTSSDGEANVHLIYKGYGKAAAITPAAEIEGLVPGADPASLVGQRVRVMPHATAYMRAIVRQMEKNQQGEERIVYQCMTSRIIPNYIGSAMPKWFGLVFLLTLLAAAMSTLSSQFHALGTAIGRDVVEQMTGRHEASVNITRAGILIGIIIAVIISYLNPGGGFIIARATAIFFGLCASAFLPAFLGALFFRWVTKAGAIASMVAGFAVTAFWLLLVKEAEAAALGLVFLVTGGKPSIFAGHGTLPVVDPIVVALPISIIVLIVVSLVTRRPDEEHLQRCFAD
jgi:SSS family solute:Na+ symporter